MLSIIMLRLMRLKDEFVIFLLMTAMALAFSFITGMAGNAEYTPTVLIVDNDNSEYSDKLIKEIESNNTFKYEKTNYDDAEDKVDKGKALAAVVIEEGFEESIKVGKTPTLGIIKIKDDRDIFTLERTVSTITSKLVDNIKTAQITADYISNANGSNKLEIFNKAYGYTLESWEYKKPVVLSKKIFDSSNQNGYDNSKHGIIGFALFFSMYTIVFAIGEILNERKYNTWQRLIMSPISNKSILGGNLIVSFLIGLIQVSVIFIVGKYGFGVDLGNSILGVIIISAAFVFSVTSLGLLLSGIVKTHSQLAALTPIVLTSMGMLGGCMWPLDIVKSKILLAFANITPTKWAVYGIEKIAMYGGGLNDAITPTLILLTMGTIFFIIGVKLVRFE